MKKVFAVILIASMLFALDGCAAQSEDSSVGTGVPGEVDKIDWSGYDALLEQSGKEPDAEARSLLLHRAEEMLMDSGAVIPYAFNSEYYLCRSNITGIFMDSMGIFCLERAQRTDGDADTPVRICAVSDISSLDPASDLTVAIGILSRLFFGGLLRSSEDGLVPDMAESYEVSEDGLTYTFRIREGLRWSDGTALDADDFVYTWKRNTDPETAGSGSELFNVIKGFGDELAVFSEENGRVFRVELSYPCVYFPELCAYPLFCPVPQQAVEGATGYRDENGNIVGLRAWSNEAGFPCCGPYVLTEWKRGETMVLKKNPYYYDAENIPTETLELMLSNEALTCYSAYEVGDLDVLYAAIPGDVVRDKMKDPEFHLMTSPNISAIYFNVNSGLFAGMTQEEAATFRHAVALALDRQFLLDIALNNGSVLADTYVPSCIGDGTGRLFCETTDAYQYPYENGYLRDGTDLEGARELLRSIGFVFGSDGKLVSPISIDFTYSGAASERIAACLQADLAQLGIILQLHSVESSIFWEECRSGHHDMCDAGWVADFNDPVSFLTIFTSGAESNICQLGE